MAGFALRGSTIDSTSRCRRPGARLRVLGLLLAALLTARTMPAGAQTVDAKVWVTDGTVNTVVLDGNTIYLGGYFSYVGPVTGAGVPLSTVGGGIVQPYAYLEGPLPPEASQGQIHAVVPDGSGGWFVGGWFSA